jgi:hypothetical protein
MRKPPTGERIEFGDDIIDLQIDITFFFMISGEKAF